MPFTDKFAAENKRNECRIAVPYSSVVNWKCDLPWIRWQKRNESKAKSKPVLEIVALDSLSITSRTFARLQIHHWTFYWKRKYFLPMLFFVSWTWSLDNQLNNKVFYCNPRTVYTNSGSMWQRIESKSHSTIKYAIPKCDNRKINSNERM